MKFDTVKEMLDALHESELYDCETERIVWLYNDQDSIACGYCSPQISDLSEVRGLIYDDPTHECYKPGMMSNTDFCEDNLDVDWIEVVRI